MDATTLVLAVDSSQVNSASTALQRMAGEGARAESVSSKLTSAAAVQGKTLSTGLVPAATKAATAYDGIVDASKELVSANGRQGAALLGGVAQTNSALATTAAEAGKAAGAVQALNAAVAAIPAARPVAALFQPPRSQTVQEIAQTPVAARAVSAPMSYRDFVSERMGPLRQQYKEEGLPNQEAHTKAIRQISAEWREYKRTGVDAQTAVTAAAAAAAAALAATAPEIDKVKRAFDAVTVAPLDEAMVRANAAARLANQSAPAARPAAQFSGFGSLGGVPPTAAKGVAELGQAQKLTAHQAQQLSFQLNDLFVQMASGQSPITALIQQGSQLNGTFGGVGGTFRALGTLITPVSVAITAAAAALGTVGFAYYQASQQSKAFNNAIVLSGNFAGKTEDQVGEMAKGIADSTRTSVSSVREMINALIGTGQIGPEVFDAAVEAAVRYGNATGQTAEEVAGHFAKMAQSPTKFADELNKTNNLFSAAERASIKALEDAGRTEDAQSAVIAKVVERYRGLDKNLGDMERLLDTGKSKWFQFWDAVLDRAGNRSLQAKIAELRELANTGVTVDFSSGTPRPVAAAPSVVTAANDAIKVEQEKEAQKRVDAAAEARASSTKKAATAARQDLDPILARTKPLEALNKALQLNEIRFARAAAGGVAYTEAEKKAINAQTRKDMTPAAGPANNEAGQILREQLADDLSAFKIALAAEKEALAFHQREMQGVYQAGGISLKAFFDDKRATIADGVAAESAALDKEIARLKEYQAAIKDPSEKIRVGKQIGQVEAEKAKVQTTGDRDTKLTNQEEAASFKALNDQIVNYNANLLQMAGDELGAARLRAQVTIDNARILAAQGAKDAAGNPVNVDVSALQRAIATTNEFADVQRQAGVLAQSAARAQEAAYLAAEQGGLSLRETENAIYAVRVKELEQLGALAAKAKELADASTDPRIKQYAADLALAYAKAADQIDPALNRLREAQKDLAAGIAGNLNIGLATLGQEYSKRRQDADKEVKEEKDRFDRRIEIQQGYLAAAASAEDKARARKRIKELEAQRDSVQGEGKGKSLLQAVNTNILQPMAEQAFATVNKLLVADPLQKYLENQFRSMTEGSGVFASFFKDMLGIKDVAANPKLLADQAAATATGALTTSLTVQTTAVQASTLALEALASAATSAAGGATAGGGGLLGSIGGLLGGRAGTMATSSAGMAAGQGVSASALANLLEYGLAEGGLVKGPGTGTSDSIPAKLSNGEFVVPAKATSVFLPVLEAMRSGQDSASVLGGLLERLGVGDDKASALRVHGARELGGPVSAGKLYRVNEKRPELLNVGNKQYLMMGSQGGKIDPNPQGAGGGAPINQTINFVSQGTPDRRTQAQLANAAYSGGMRAKARIG